MKSLKILLNLAYLLVLISSVSAQQYSYPNELKGFEFFKNGKWKTLVPYVSTQEDVKKIFGEECLKGCDYDANWRVEIQFVEQSWRGSERGTIPCASEDYLGKYESISFYPKKRVKKDQLRFGKAFNYGAERIDDSAEPNRGFYSDRYGLVYAIYAENAENHSFRKGDLVAIHYGVSIRNYDKYKGKAFC